MSPRKATRERGYEAHPLPCTEHPEKLGSVHPYCLPRALSRLLLMVSRKSVVFRKCSFSFTLPREHQGGLRPPGGHHQALPRHIRPQATRPRSKVASSPLLEGHNKFGRKFKVTGYPAQAS